MKNVTFNRPKGVYGAGNIIIYVLKLNKHFFCKWGYTVKTITSNCLFHSNFQIKLTQK